MLDLEIIPAPKLGQGVPPTSAAAIADQFHGVQGVLIVDFDGGASDGLRSEIERRIAA